MESSSHDEFIPVEFFHHYAIKDLKSFPTLSDSVPSAINFSFSCVFTNSVFWGDESRLRKSKTSLMDADVSVSLRLFRRYPETTSAFIKDAIKAWPIHDFFVEDMIDSAYHQAEDALKTMPADRAHVTVRCLVFAHHRTIHFLETTGEIMSSESCRICLEEFCELGSLMPCKHVFHRDCIAKWLSVSRSCPICRFQMP